ncbi:fungal-specific transcription factor domain-containing protein [Entophlyctis helioformis]|nr:fungal-specific transcription factor domain-containing protein [Entophlyctis helioformis]
MATTTTARQTLAARVQRLSTAVFLASLDTTGTARSGTAHLSPRPDIRHDLLRLHFAYSHIRQPIYHAASFTRDAASAHPFVLYAIYGHVSTLAGCVPPTVPLVCPSPEEGAIYMHIAKRLLADAIAAPSCEVVVALLLVADWVGRGDKDAALLYIGVASRMAQQLGLYREDSRLVSRPPYTIEQEVRRRTWWLVYELDRTTSLIAKVPPVIAENNLMIGYPMMDELWADCELPLESEIRESTVHGLPRFYSEAEPFGPSSRLSAARSTGSSSGHGRVNKSVGTTSGRRGRTSQSQAPLPAPPPPPPPLHAHYGGTTLTDPVAANPWIHQAKLSRIYYRVSEFLARAPRMPPADADIERRLLDLSLAHWWSGFNAAAEVIEADRHLTAVSNRTDRGTWAQAEGGIAAEAEGSELDMGTAETVTWHYTFLPYRFAVARIAVQFTSVFRVFAAAHPDPSSPAQAPSSGGRGNKAVGQWTEVDTRDVDGFRIALSTAHEMAGRLDGLLATNADMIGAPHGIEGCFLHSGVVLMMAQRLPDAMLRAVCAGVYSTGGGSSASASASGSATRRLERDIEIHARAMNVIGLRTSVAAQRGKLFSVARSATDASMLAALVKQYIATNTE